jgi:hypothetical protein
MKLSVALAVAMGIAPMMMGNIIVDSSFENVTITTGAGYAYQSPQPLAPNQDLNSAGPWQYVNGAGNGLAQFGSPFNVPVGLDGITAAFLQDAGGSISQSVVLGGGAHTLTFLLGGRAGEGCCDGNQTVNVLLGADVIGTFSTNSFAPFTLQTVNFDVSTPGATTLSFVGTSAGDHTAFIDNVSLTEVPEPAAIGLISFGLGAMLYLRRLRRA